MTAREEQPSWLPESVLGKLKRILFSKFGKLTHLTVFAVLLGGSAACAFADDIDLTGYTLTFSDEFDRLSVSPNSPKGSATWYTLPPNGGPGYFSNSLWDSATLSADYGILSSKAWQDSSKRWHSGYMASIDTTGAGFSQQYGYFEIRAQMPNSGTGTWPAFWLTCASSISGPARKNEEIDVLEWYGVAHDNSPGLMQQGSHNWNPDGSQSGGLYSPQTKMPDGSQPWAGYHIYGVKIDPSFITWYIDGVQTNQIATTADYLVSPFYLMIDYGLGGGWPLNGVVNNSSLNVDWVRVYSLPSATVTPTPTPTPAPTPAPVTVTPGSSLGDFLVLNKSASSGNGMALPYQSSQEGEPLGLFWSGSATASFSTFRVLSMGNSAYKMVETLGGRCVGITASNAVIQTCSSAATQLFSILPQTDGSYVIRSGSNSSCLAAPGAFTYVVPGSCNSLPEQNWNFVGSTALAITK